MDTAISVLRWIAVLPGAFLAGSLARLVVGVLNWLATPAYDAESILGQFGTGCIMAGAFAVAVVWSGALIAPAKRNETGVVLAVLILLFYGVSVSLVVLGMPTSTQLSDPRVLGEFIGTPAASIYALAAAWRGELH